DKMFASVNNVNTSLVYLSIILIVLVVLYYIRFHRYLDVLALGKDQATNLGVPYNYVVKRLLIIVAILISIATALIGPLTFLELIVVHVCVFETKSIVIINFVCGIYFISLLLNEN